MGRWWSGVIGGLIWAVGCGAGEDVAEQVVALPLGDSPIGEPSARSLGGGGDSLFVTEGGFLYRIDKRDSQVQPLGFSTVSLHAVAIRELSSDYTLVHSTDSNCVGGALYRVDNDSGVAEQLINCVRDFAVGDDGVYAVHYDGGTTRTTLTRIDRETLRATQIGSLEGVLSTDAGIANVSVNDDAVFVCLRLVNEVAGGPTHQVLLRVDPETGASTEVSGATRCEAGQGIVYFTNGVGRVCAANSSDAQPTVFDIAPETGELGRVTGLVKGASGVFVVTSEGVFRLGAITAERATSIEPPEAPYVDETHAYWLEPDGVFRVELD